MADINFDEKEGMMISWKEGKETKVVPFTQLYSAIVDKAQAVPHSTQASDIYRDAYQGNISIRDEFTTADYENYRPSESLPRSGKGRIKAGMDAYYNHGIIRNIVDLMGDFAVQGIDVVHSSKRLEKWHRKYWKIIKGKERSERLANYCARMANVIIKRETGTITLKQSKEFQKTEGATSDEFLANTFKLEKREIPSRYIFLNPLTLEVMGEELNTFVDPDSIQYGLRLPQSLVQKIAYPTNNEEKKLISLLPKDIVNRIRSGDNLLPLERNKIRSIFYKKDDWDIWATPIICSILPELITLKKMQLADRAALDGVISQLRVWKLGNIENKIWPTPAAMSKLANILMNSVGGGVMDIIWGPDLELKETTTQVHQFLGETKYIPILNAIYAGLGVPPLFSGSTSQGSFTTNFLAIKTLIERLEYIRERLREFWNYELELVAKAMGFNEPAQVTFDRMTLNDESSILTIIAGMVDRGILSEEYAQEMVGAIPEIEEFRKRREEKERKVGKRPVKAGPFHNPLIDHDLKKIALQTGVASPSEVGLELEEKKNGEKSTLEMQEQTQIKVAKFKPKGVSGQGRPKTSKDKKKRKQKIVKPRRSINSLTANLTWAEEAQSFISEHFTPILLKVIKKNNLRKLTAEEFENFEKFKFNTLMNLPFKSVVSEKVLNDIVSRPLSVPIIVEKLLSSCVQNYKRQFNKEEIGIEQRRRIQSIVYAAYNSEIIGSDIDTTSLTMPVMS